MTEQSFNNYIKHVKDNVGQIVMYLEYLEKDRTTKFSSFQLDILTQLRSNMTVVLQGLKQAKADEDWTMIN